MGWFGKREKPGKPQRTRPTPQARPPEPSLEPDEADGESLYCVACGAELGFDPEDTPDAEGPGRHLCGECYRAREFDADLQMLWWRGDLR